MPAKNWKIAPNLSISRVLVGLWQIADMERNRPLETAETAETLRPYVDAGLTTFDMADHYGSAELIAGELRQSSNPRPIQCLTKWVPAPGPITRTGARNAVIRAMERLKTDAIDLLQFHMWRYEDPGYWDALHYLQEMKQEGLIRHLGLTNVDTIHLNMIRQSGIEVVSNQVCFSLLDQRAAAGKMLTYCRNQGVSVLAFGTLAGGFLSEKWLNKDRPGPNEPLTWSQMKYLRFIDEAGGWETYQRLLSLLKSISLKYDASLSNIASRYVLDQPGVGGVIIGTRPGVSEHIADNLRLFDLNLSGADRDAIVAATSSLTPIPGDCGDEYRKPPYLTASGDLSDHFGGMPSPYEKYCQGTGRSIALSGTTWEDLAGFSRAVRKGDRIMVSGTTATHGDRLIGGADPSAQTHFVIDKIEGALVSLGGSLSDVVRTRVYVPGMDHWEAVARAHGERFREIKPANTLVQSGLVGSEYLVEIEAEADVT